MSDMMISGNAETPITEMRMKTDFYSSLSVVSRMYVSIGIILFDPLYIEGRCLYSHHLAPYDRWAVSVVAFGAVIMVFNVTSCMTIDGIKCHDMTLKTHCFETGSSKQDS
jgi:hypothetical protein